MVRLVVEYARAASYPMRREALSPASQEVDQPDKPDEEEDSGDDRCCDGYARTFGGRRGG